MTADHGLSKECQSRLIEAAAAEGVTPTQWVESRLPPPRVDSAGPVSPEVRALLWAHVVSVPEAVGIDNESIDADLARAYAHTHDDEAVSGLVE
jgi:hypothetical protein